ncbi:MAG: CHRD domain-containing protein [Chitinophagaceae bacterium]|nr:CHRD domain-containing protein [Chitinophagaceae bacterium]
MKLYFCCLLTMFFLWGCEKKEEGRTFENHNITLNGEQETPPTPSTATGEMDATYDQKTKFLSYTVTWSGLTGPVTLMHIHGFADPGFAAGPIQNIITPSSGIDVPNATKYGTSGSISARLFIDGVAIKEAHLLAGKLYINIHTSTYPAGEIRGQIVLH